jgi:hypothetical protein
MALGTYTDILAGVAAWLNRSDLTAVIPDFITLAEARIARDMRLRRQVTNAALLTVGGAQSVALPADFLEIENISLSSASPVGALSVVTPEILDRRYPAGHNAGQPAVYAMLADTLLFGPTPDAAYTVSLDYYKRFDALATAPTNWLLTNYPMVYLAGALTEAWLYLQEDAKVVMWDTRYRAECATLQATDDAALYSGSSMRVRAL